MRLLKIMLPLVALLIGSVAAKAQYDPASPPEPGVYFTLTERCVPEYSLMTYNPVRTVAFGSNVSVSASLNTGFKFIQWEDEDGTVISTSINFTYVMPAKDVTLIARCEYNPSSPAEPSTPEFKDVSYISFKMNPSDGGYMYSGSNGDYEVGTTQRFTARANSNYNFVNWTCEGIELGTSSTLEYTVPKGDRILVANFSYDPSSPVEPSVPNIPRTLTLKSNLEGATSSFTGAGSHTVGSSFTVSERSNTYYHFVKWTDEDGNVVSETSSFTYTMPNRDITLTANYTYDYNPSSPGEPGTPNPDTGMAENMVLWPRMGMYDDTHVQILCETPGATIHYTIDGSTPTAASPIYTEPVFVGSNLLVKAIAYKEGMEDSPVVSYQVTSYKTGTPIFTFENKLLKITSDTPDAIIRYTTDFTDPSAESEVYTAPFEPEENCRIKAYASKEGLTDSPINIYVFRRADHTIPAPTFLINDDGKLVIVPSVSGGTTHYTTDGTTPTTESPVYTIPLDLDGNYIIKAYTVHTNFYDSPVGEYAAEGFIVEKPMFSFENPLLIITIGTEGASIHYTLDGSIPTEESTLYTAPIRLTTDCRIVAKGFKNRYIASDTVVFNYVYKDFQLPTPTANFANKQLTLTCSDPEARIHYTTRGATPSANATQYTAPIALTADCTVKFIAIRPNFNDSEIATFEFKVADYRVETPVVKHDLETMKVTMVCGTEGAAIRYTTDGSVPTASTGTLYQNPVDVDGNMTFTVKAFRSDLFDSETTVYKVDDMKLPTPKATYGKRALTIVCEDTTAIIRYTIDGTAPTESSTRYTNPVALTADCTVRFIATKDSYVSSEEGSYKFVLADWQETPPTLTPNYANRIITIEQVNFLPVSVTIKGLLFSNSTDTMESPATINVSRDMASVSVVTVAQNEDRYNSKPVSFNVVFHRPPVMDDYDGHTLYLNVSENEPAAEDAVINVYIDGRHEITGSTSGMKIEISDFCDVKAFVQSDVAFISDEAERTIDYFNTGRIAGVRNGHRLAEVIGTWGDDPNDYSYIRVKGDLNKADMQTIAGLNQLTSLHIDSDLTDEDYGNILSNTRIETICSKTFPKGMIAGMPRLTTLIWGNEGNTMPEGIIAEGSNPNLLVWVSDQAAAPADASNLVRFAASEIYNVADPESEVEGHAESITLQPGYPFNAHMPMKADYIELTKNFSLPTFIGYCAGWETLTLPFSPEKMEHEKAGDIVPFKAWNANDIQGPKPYWLYNADSNGWQEADSIKAGIPYIISMPNNPEYVEAFNLPGTVKFSATGVTLGTEEQAPAITDWKDGDKFEGTYMPEEGTDIYSLNVNATDEGVYAGSEFVPGEVTLPFGAFMRSQSGRRAIPVFDNGGSNGIQLPTLSAGGFLVESPAPGVLRICSARSLHTAIFTPEGAKVKVLDLKAGETATAEGLTRGLYICGGVKIMVK